MSGAPSTAADRGPELLALYDRALPDVYGYLFHRCGDRPTAEDLTSETFMAAVDAVRRGTDADLSPAWLVGIARHKLADHWRGQARHTRRLQAVAAQPARADDPWEGQLDRVVAAGVLAQLAPHHRTALTLRYLDGLPVPEVAEILGRTVHATEALLVRARTAFRYLYPEGGDRG